MVDTRIGFLTQQMVTIVVIGQLATQQRHDHLLLHLHHGETIDVR